MNCKVCGEIISGNEKFCQSCGSATNSISDVDKDVHNKKNSEPEGPRGSKLEPSSKPNGNTITIPEDRQNIEDEQVNQTYRNRVTPEAPIQEDLFCKDCGQVLKAQARFCPRCGTKVTLDNKNDGLDTFSNENTINEEKGLKQDNVVNNLVYLSCPQCGGHEIQILTKRSLVYISICFILSFIFTAGGDPVSFLLLIFFLILGIRTYIVNKRLNNKHIDSQKYLFCKTCNKNFEIRGIE